MPQEIENPIASPRAGGYKAGDEVTMTMRVVGTRPDGSPIFEMASPAAPVASNEPTKPKASAPSDGDSIMSKVLAKRDKILSLPEGTRNIVVERLFDRLIAPKIPKAMDEGQKNLIKQRFVDTLVGQSPTQDPGQNPEDVARAGRMPHGSFGVARAGVMEGLANMLQALRREGYKLHYGDKGKPPSMEELITKKDPFESYGTKGLGYLAEQWLRKQIEEQRGFTKPYEERSKPHNLPLIGPTTRADVASGSGKLLSSMPLDLATAELIPGAKGAKLLGRVASGAGKGAVAGGVTAPSFGQDVTSGMAGGAVLGGILPVLGAPFRRGASPLKMRVPSKTATPIVGAAENASSELEKLAQTHFQKSLNELTPDQKIELVNKWRDASVTTTKAERVTAKKAAEQAKVDAVIAKQTAKIDQRVATRRAMDEAKALQKRITEFVKTNKRAPNEEELVNLRKAPAAEAAAAPAAAPKAEERGIKKPERRTFLRTEEKDVKEYYSYRFNQLRDEIKNAATPEEKAAAERRLAALVEVQKAHPTSMGDVHEFKAESPEAIKAVSAVADVTKVADQIKPATPEVKVVPEGQHGKGVIGKRAKDAERKAAARAKDIREQPEPAAPGTPETALLSKEEEFLKLTDSIEAMGPKGKEAAKNLDKFRRAGRITMDQALEMGNKVLEAFQKGTVPTK